MSRDTGHHASFDQLRSAHAIIVAVFVAASGLIGALLLIRGAMAQPPPSATPVGNYIIAEDINVRSGPGEMYPSIGRLTRGSALLPLNRNEQGNWVLISYGRGFGWVRRDLAVWNSNIEALPVLSESDLTPTPRSSLPTHTFVPPTATPTIDHVVVGAEGAYLRSGPGYEFTVLGVAFNGDPLEPVGRDPGTDWILIRYADGFAWIAQPLGGWVTDLTRLPVLQRGALTPSRTFTASPTATLTASPTATFTPSPTAAFTASPTATLTASPTATLTATITTTLESTPELTTSGSAVPTAALTSANTVQPTPTAPPTDMAVIMITSPAAMSGLSPTVTTSPTATATRATDTPSPEAAATSTDTVQHIPSPSSDTSTSDSQSAPVELIISGILLMGGLVYGFLYWRGQIAADRYDAGFVIDRCPVCGGEIHVTINQKRVFGIARVRTTVRCTNCRSVLREVAARRWRYAVDHNYSLTLFHRFNGKVIDEPALIALGEDAPPPRRDDAGLKISDKGDPEFIDE